MYTILQFYMIHKLSIYNFSYFSTNFIKGAFMVLLGFISSKFSKKSVLGQLIISRCHMCKINLKFQNKIAS